MDLSNEGICILPTLGRVHTRLPRFFDAARATHIKVPGVVVVEEEEYKREREAYNHLWLPDNWSVLVVEGGCTSASTNQAIALTGAMDMDWVMWVTDDSLPETDMWDQKVLAQLNGCNIISTDDGWQAPKRATGCVAWSGDMLRAVGYMWPPGCQHHYCDDLIEELGRETATWYVDMNVMLRHEHAEITGKKDDTARKADSFFGADTIVWQAWKKNEKGKALDRIFNLMKTYGADVVKPDLTGELIMLACPTGDGKYDRVFQRSYVATRDAVRQYGGELYLAEAPFLADIALARNKLFGAFLRSNATKCFFVDSDQGWQVKDFIRLLMVKRDFVGVAGVRKTAKPSFAVNNTDDWGNAIQIVHSAVDGLIEVSHVGFAFVCVSKAWAVRMSQHYADLAFVGPDGQEDYAIFNPMVFNRRYLSEDYAACQRWRDIGGKVMVAPEVSLEHVGSKTWEGDWLTALANEADRQRASSLQG